jgi:hypothetical protein
VDTTAPEIDAGAIRASYALGERAAPKFACTDGGSGVAACNGPAAVNTASAGDHELVVTARDRAGNERTLHVRYTVLAPAATPVPQPAAPAAPVTPATAPVTPVAAPKPALKISVATAKRHGRTLTLTVRGTGSGISAVRLAVSGGKRTVKLTNGRWKATLKVRIKGKPPKRLKVTATAGGVRAQRTVRVR